LVELGVGVTVGVVVTVGVTVGLGVISQSKIAVKSKTVQLTVGVGVGVTHTPAEKYVSQMSGQLEIQGLAPNSVQLPPKEDETHQYSLVPVT